MMLGVLVIEKTLKEGAVKDICMANNSCSIASIPLIIRYGDPLKTMIALAIFVLRSLVIRNPAIFLYKSNQEILGSMMGK